MQHIFLVLIYNCISLKLYATQNSFKLVQRYPNVKYTNHVARHLCPSFLANNASWTMFWQCTGFQPVDNLCGIGPFPGGGWSWTTSGFFPTHPRFGISHAM